MVYIYINIPDRKREAAAEGGGVPRRREARAEAGGVPHDAVTER